MLVSVLASCCLQRDDKPYTAELKRPAGQPLRHGGRAVAANEHLDEIPAAQRPRVFHEPPHWWSPAYHGATVSMTGLSMREQNASEDNSVIACLVTSCVDKHDRTFPCQVAQCRVIATATAKLPCWEPS